MSQHIFATATVILGIWTSAVFGQESTLWTYSSGDEDIGHFEITPSGSIFTSREDRVVMLELDTGNVIWERFSSSTGLLPHKVASPRGIEPLLPG